MMLLAASLHFASCSKDTQSGPTAVTGEWHLTSVTGLDLATADVDVYVVFGDDTFELYQKLGEGRHYRFSGTYTVSGTSLDGVYGDGTPWGGSYTFSVGENGNMLTMVSINAAGYEETCTYARETVPDEVKSEAVVLKSSASGAPVPFL